MCFFLKSILHFFVSNSRHGTHSPFVYALTDAVIYTEKKELKVGQTKDDALIEEILNYYNLSKETTNLSRAEGRTALVVSIAAIEGEEIGDLLSRFELIIVKDIHQSKYFNRQWERVCKSHKVIVSIDLLHFGMLCYRSGQTKEHFKLRFPFWLY